MKNSKVFLNRVKAALAKEGFRWTPFQKRKRSQVFGLVKDLDNVWQMHVRGFSNGRLEAEIEISRFYFQHPGPSRPATTELAYILDTHGIPCKLTDLERTTIELELPKSLIDWRPLVLFALIYFLFIA